MSDTYFQHKLLTKRSMLKVLTQLFKLSTQTSNPMQAPSQPPWPSQTTPPSNFLCFSTTSHCMGYSSQSWSTCTPLSRKHQSSLACTTTSGIWGLSGHGHGHEGHGQTAPSPCMYCWSHSACAHSTTDCNNRHWVTNCNFHWYERWQHPKLLLDYPPPPPDKVGPLLFLC